MLASGRPNATTPLPGGGQSTATRQIQSQLTAPGRDEARPSCDSGESQQQNVVHERDLLIKRIAGAARHRRHERRWSLW